MGPYLARTGKLVDAVKSMPRLESNPHEGHTEGRIDPENALHLRQKQTQEKVTQEASSLRNSGAQTSPCMLGSRSAI